MNNSINICNNKKEEDRMETIVLNEMNLLMTYVSRLKSLVQTMM